jgi:hypothetical protein
MTEKMADFNEVHDHGLVESGEYNSGGLFVTKCHDTTRINSASISFRRTLMARTA